MLPPKFSPDSPAPARHRVQCLFHGKSEHQMDDNWGYPHVMTLETSIYIYIYIYAIMIYIYLQDIQKTEAP